VRGRGMGRGDVGHLCNADAEYLCVAQEFISGAVW
jgi:hypothetical protein